ncbi:hypothetical protein D3C76_1017820 [compost metagenome]
MAAPASDVRRIPRQAPDCLGQRCAPTASTRDGVVRARRAGGRDHASCAARRGLRPAGGAAAPLPAVVQEHQSSRPVHPLARQRSAGAALPASGAADHGHLELPADLAHRQGRELAGRVDRRATDVAMAGPGGAAAGDPGDPARRYVRGPCAAGAADGQHPGESVSRPGARLPDRECAERHGPIRRGAPLLQLAGWPLPAFEQL